MQDNVKQNITPKKEKTPFTKGFIEQLELVVIFFAIIILAFSFICKSCMVDGDSMLNTLHHQDRVIVWNLFYKPDYGDIVVIHDNDNLNKPIVKRVIGLPGETVEIKNGAVFIDGDPIKETYLKEPMRGEYGPYVVPEGSYFMLGDNRNSSQDSRKWKNTFLKEEDIMAKVLFRYSPSFQWYSDVSYE